MAVCSQFAATFFPLPFSCFRFFISLPFRERERMRKEKKGKKKKGKSHSMEQKTPATKKKRFLERRNEISRNWKRKKAFLTISLSF